MSDTNISSPSLNLVVLISGSGTNLQAIIDAIGAGEMNARIVAVVSDKEGAVGIERATAANLDTWTITELKQETREQYDRRLDALIQPLTPDLIILAGFMRILSPWFVQQYSAKILNIHPSLLPKFKGMNTHQRVLDAGEATHGATVHVVTQDLDDGPIVMQASVAIHPSDDAETLRLRVLQQEHKLYPEAIMKYANPD